MLRPYSIHAETPLAQFRTQSHIYVNQCINIRCTCRWRILSTDPLGGAAGLDSVTRRPEPSPPAPSAKRAFRFLDPGRARDACRVGFVARADGERNREIPTTAPTPLAPRPPHPAPPPHKA